jgi:RND family efflux transporter MFP subunit
MTPLQTLRIGAPARPADRAPLGTAAARLAPARAPSAPAPPPAVARATSAAAALLLAAGLLAACTPPSEQQNVEFRVPVSVEEVGVATIEDRIVTTGTLRTREVVTLNVLDTGLLEIGEGPSGRLAEGDLVAAGDEIARIVGEDVRLAARLAAARRAYEAARSDLEANMALFDRGLINQTVIDTKESAFEDAKLEYERSRRTEDRNRLITPIDGVILKLARDGEGQLMANGQLVNPGQMVAQIAPLDPLIADVDLIGEDIAAVRVGLEARARYHAWGERTFAGKVLRIAPTVDQRTRALRAEVEIDNHDRVLRPGMFLEVTVIGERRENVTVIPRRALTDRGGRRVVFVLRGQRVVRQEVALGLGDDEIVEVREGVAPGDRVVVRGLETLTDQMFVRVTES